MDRQIMMAVGFAVFCMLAFGGMLLGSSAPAPNSDFTRPTYAKDDIRYRFQQAEAKEAKRHPKKPARKPEPERPVTNGPTSTGGSDGGDGGDGDAGSGDDPNEEPSVTDHEPQEEPPLE